MKRQTNRKETLALFNEILSKYNLKENFITFEKGQNNDLAEKINPTCTLADVLTALISKKKVSNVIGFSNQRINDVVAYLISGILMIPCKFVTYLWGEQLEKALQLLEDKNVDVSREFYNKNGLI